MACVGLLLLSNRSMVALTAARLFQPDMKLTCFDFEKKKRKERSVNRRCEVRDFVRRSKLLLIDCRQKEERNVFLLLEGVRNSKLENCRK